jgi:hypothetical protein
VAKLFYVTKESLSTDSGIIKRKSIKLAFGTDYNTIPAFNMLGRMPNIKS